ncbi:Serpin domain [Trinorchestia longiramus]|nr:Serpin domain [Trinorchestia longiramus]
MKSLPWTGLVTVLLLVTAAAQLSSAQSDNISALPRSTNAFAEILEHPLGDTRFQFFLYDQEGSFIQRWITLQQIQDLLVSHRVRFVSGDDNEVVASGETSATPPPLPILVAGPHWHHQQAVIQRPDVNIDGVVDTVHKVCVARRVEVSHVNIDGVVDTVHKVHVAMQLAVLHVNIDGVVDTVHKVRVAMQLAVPRVNIDGVVDTVHKVMADEVANTAMTESTTSLDDQELVTLSNNIIQQLIREQFFQFVSDNSHAAHADQMSYDDGVSTDASVNVDSFASGKLESETTVPFLESTENSIEFSSLQTDELEDEIAFLSTTLLDTSRDEDYVDDSSIYDASVTESNSVTESTTLGDVSIEKNIFNSDGDESSTTKPDDFALSTTYASGDFELTAATTNDGNAPSYTLIPMIENDSDFTESTIAADVQIITDGIEVHTQASPNLNSSGISDLNNSSLSTTEETSTDNISFASQDIGTTVNELSSSDNTIATNTTNRPEYTNSTEKISSIGYSPNDLIIDRLSVGDYEFPNYLYNYDYDNAAAHFSNVLLPSQMATDAFHDNMDFNDDSDLPENYDYYSQKIYLDPETQDYYEKQYHSNGLNISKTSMPSELDFPGKDVAASYHPVEVQSDFAPESSRPSSSTTTSDTYLSAANPVAGGSSTSTTDAVSGHETLKEIGVSAPPKTNILSQAPSGNLGLEETTQNLSPTIKQFIATMNDVAFKVYRQGAHLHRSQNFVLSPLNLISVLSMLLLGSRGNTSIVLADLLRTDDFRNFNPHLLLKNIRADIDKNNVDSNIAFSTHMFVELPRQNSVHSLDFFKQTIDYFYGSTAEEADWSTVGARARIRVNEAVTNQTEDRVATFLDDDVSIHSPFSIVSSALMQSPWSVPILESDLFDMSFIRFPSAERRLVRTIGISKQLTINAGYSPEEDATIAEIPLSLLSGELSMILVLPGEQKSFVANGLKQIESRLTPERWSALIRSMVPHRLTVQVPLFRHRSYTDVSQLLKLIGLDALFKEKEADYSGVNSIKSLHLADVVQLTEFHSCLLENSSFSFRSASFPSSSTSNNSRDSLQNKIRVSLFQDDDQLFIRGANHLNASNRNESILTPSWRLTKDAPGFDDDDFEIASKDSEKTPSNIESTNFKYSTTQEGRERRKKIFPVQHEQSGGAHERDDFQSKFELSGNEFELLNPHSKNLDPPNSNDHEVKKASQSNSVHWLQNSRSGLRHRRNTGELSRKTRNPHRRKLSRSVKGPTVAFDRAFMYVIRHNPTGLILHIGRYLDPI